VIFILAAMLTPGPDIFSQFMMAVPMLLLYEAGIFLSGAGRAKQNQPGE
jgi:sec-independent protein translocase protein TatC